MTRPVYAIGDVHGQAELLDRALGLIEADGGPDARVVFLGDYVDRGPDSRGVLDRLARGLDEGRNWVALLGNHDRMFHRFVTEAVIDDANISSGRSWLNRALGGTATLASYGVAANESRPLAPIREAAHRAVPQRHVDLIAGLPLWHVEGELLFVHAGIRPGVPLERQAEDDLIWIRDGFLDDPRDHGRLVVHGHTALAAPAHFGNRVDLDGGAGYGRPLLPARFDGRDCQILTPGGPISLPPPADWRPR